MAVERNTCWFGASVFVAGALLVTFSCADESPAARNAAAPEASERAALAKQIRELVDELHAARRQRSEADRRHRETLDRLGRQIETLQSQLEPSERAVAEQRRETANFEQAISTDKRTASDASAWIGNVADLVAPFADRALRRIERSPADDAAVRAADLAAVVKLMGDADPLRRGAGAADALGIVGESWLAARTVGVTNEPVVFDSGRRTHHAWVYRLGLAGKAFVSEDGRTVGLWSGDPQSPWRVDLAEAQSEQIRRLVAIAREKQPPAIVPVPIVRLAGAEGE